MHARVTVSQNVRQGLLFLNFYSNLGTVATAAAGSIVDSSSYVRHGVVVARSRQGFI